MTTTRTWSGRPVNSSPGAIAPRIAAAAVAAFLATPALAADDWLDDMPSVARVAEAVDRAYDGVEAKQSTVAVNTAAALILLRQLMEYQAAEDPAMTPERRARMQAIADAYLLAELAIGRRPGARRGALNEAQVRQFYESRRYEKCATRDCYLYWMRFQLEWWASFRFRELLFPLLFPCGDAPALLELARRHAINAPLIPSTPAAPLAGDAAESARLERLVSAPAACTAEGADVDGDGACSDWEAGLLRGRAQLAATAGQCPVLTLHSATTEDAASIRVSYTAGPGLAGRPIRLTACRASVQTLTKCEGPLMQPIGVETLSTPEQLEPGRHEATILRRTVLTPDTATPYVIVVGDAAGQSSRTYFHKWMMGVAIHGYTFRNWLAIAGMTEITEDAMRQLQLGDEGVEPWQTAMVQSLKTSACYDAATFAADWRFDSTLEIASLLTARARELYREVARRAINMTHQHEGDVVDLHLIGHSRGTIVISELLKEWLKESKLRPDFALRGSHVRVTLLDPHPANNGIPPPQEDYEDSDRGLLLHHSYRKIQDRIKDPLIALPGGIGIHQAEVWYQHSTLERIFDAEDVRDDMLYIAPITLWGIGGPGNHIDRLSDPSIRILWRDLTHFVLNDEIVDHTGVVNYFQHEIDRNAVPGKCVMPVR